MLFAYLDESGSDDTKFLVVAGYVSTEHQWLKFSRQWVGALQSEGVRLFHASEFENRVGEFSDWSKGRADRLMARLCTIVRERTIFSFGHCVRVADFKDVVTTIQARSRMRSAYSFCLQQCITGISEWARQRQKGALVHVFFEHGNKFSNDVISLYEQAAKNETMRNKYRIGSIKPRSKQSFVPLQAADLWAYEVFRHYSNLEGKRIRDDRKSFIALLHGNFEIRLQSKKSIRNWVERFSALHLQP